MRDRDYACPLPPFNSKPFFFGLGVQKANTNQFPFAFNKRQEPSSTFLFSSTVSLILSKAEAEKETNETKKEIPIVFNFFFFKNKGKANGSNIQKICIHKNEENNIEEEGGGPKCQCSFMPNEVK